MFIPGALKTVGGAAEGAVAPASTCVGVSGGSTPEVDPPLKFNFPVALMAGDEDDVVVVGMGS